MRKPYQLKLITAPVIEPISLTEAKTHARIDNDAEDALINSYIKAAREWCEGYQRERAYLTQTWEMSFDYYPWFPIEIPKYPVQSITSIKYFIENGGSGTETTWNASNYFTDLNSIPARIVLSENGDLPKDDLVPLGGFRIRFVAGETTANNIPASIKSAMYLLVAHLYENREASVEKALSEIPFGVKILLGIDRW
jgi:uncharacterized phiE125 gp8 family phage protein